MLRVLKFQIDWTPIAYATLASIKVHDACDNMVLMASNRFMKQIMNAHCTVSEMVRRTGLASLRAIHLILQSTSRRSGCLAHHGTACGRVREAFSKLTKISHKAEQLISAIGVKGPKEAEAQTI